MKKHEIKLIKTREGKVIKAGKNTHKKLNVYIKNIIIHLESG